MAVNRSNARLIRFAIFALVLIGCGFILFRGNSYASVNDNGLAASSAGSSVAAPAHAQNKAASGPTIPERAATQQHTKILRPPAEGERIKATFVTLARNSDLRAILGSIRQVQDRFNSKYNYDWVFLNEERFSDEFKEQTSALVTGNTKYGFIEKEQWGFPEWIDKEKAAKVREQMREKKIIYGDSVSYRHMCRFELGFFFRHPVMMEYEYYWRVEPHIELYCDIDYDIFKWMKDNNKDYSFMITLPEYGETIPTLWETTKKFIDANPQYVANNNLMSWISNDGGDTYNGCHFWSNFEIGNLNFWRSEAYVKYFEFLDKAGGFFYERWGDAPIHSIAVSLFLPMEKVHFFNDIGYYHAPFTNCPVDSEVRVAKKCICDPSKDFTWKGYSCTTKFHNIQNFPKLRGWESFAD